MSLAEYSLPLPQNACGYASGTCVWRDILRHNGARPDNTAVPDTHAGHDHHPVADPHIVANIDRLLWLEALLHHRNIRSGKIMVPGDDRYIRAHHHMVANMAGTIYLRVNPDTGIIAQRDLLTEHGVLFDIHLFAALRQHQSAAKAPQRRLPQLQAAIRYRQPLCDQMIDKCAKLPLEPHAPRQLAVWKPSI